MLSVELHSHSIYSYDGRDPPERLVDRAETVGLDGLAVTDHDEIAGSLEAVELSERRGMVGIPGMEVTSAAGHVLALGVTERVPAGLSFDETVSRIRAQDGIAVIPHPFQESRHGVMENITADQLRSADAIEVYNSRLLTGRANRQAERFARRNGIPMTAGSDAHISEMIGRAVTHVGTRDRTASSILKAIRNGRTTVEGKRTPWTVSFRQAAGGAKRRLMDRLTNIFP